MMKKYSGIDMVMALDLCSTNNEKMINIRNSDILNSFHTFYFDRISQNAIELDLCSNK